MCVSAAVVLFPNNVTLHFPMLSLSPGSHLPYKKEIKVNKVSCLTWLDASSATTYEKYMGLFRQKHLSLMTNICNGAYNISCRNAAVMLILGTPILVPFVYMHDHI